MARIVVIEDEALVGELIVLNLERAGHEVKHAATQAAGLALLAASDPDLLVVDAMLPDGNGFDIIARLRAEGRRLPVLMMTSLSDTASKVRGLDAGADDYLPKPFDLNELLARVRALLRRVEQKKIAVLLVNVGSPASPSVGDVRRYLGEFLSDPRVIDTNALFRWILLHGVILRTRPQKSAALYRAIWTEQGSPLIVHSQAQAEALQQAMPEVSVSYAMRYGAPSIPSVLDGLLARGVDRLLVVPLYPQFSLAATQSALDAVEHALAKHARRPQLTVVEPFYADAGFVEAYAQSLSTALADFDADHVLFSYHGLPKHQVAAPCDAGVCAASEACCATISAANARCYRAQSFATTRAIVERARLTLPHETAFQSRLRGRPWIEPFADARLDALAKAGKKRVLVLCPSFVTDCLETLDEVGNRFRAQFIAAGGQDLRLVPALNAEPRWINALAILCRRALFGAEKVAA